MLKIGEFSRLSQVTVATLHHYDDIGLLKPAHVDKFTSHRYYTLEQLPRIHRIMTLKELGLSLEQIAKMLNAKLPTDHLRGMLALKEAEAQQRIDEEHTRLKRIRFHIRQIDMEAEMSQLDIRIKKVDPVRALSMRFIAEDHSVFEHILRDCAPILIEKKIVDTEGKPMLADTPHFQIVYAKEYTQTNIDSELVIPVSSDWDEDITILNEWTWVVRDVRGIDHAATYVHHGNPDDVNENLVDLERWVIANGYKLSDEMRIVTLHFPMDFDMSKWVGEIQYPLEKA